MGIVAGSENKLLTAASDVTAQSPTASRVKFGMNINDRRRPQLFTLHFSIFNFQFLFLSLFLVVLCSTANAQVVADKTVASVTNGARATPDLITYSDLVWQLAIEPGRPFTAQPNSHDLNEALRTLEDQLLIVQEARKLPLVQTVEAQKEFEGEVKKKRDELAQSFGSRARLEERMKRVGLTSEQLDTILRDRVTIERYLDFRFRAFAIVSPKEISDQYEKEYRSQRNSGRIVPTLDQARDKIEHELMEAKIAEEIDKFIDSLRDQPGTEIVILNPV
ncbi:MAG: hypothetical protein DMF72_02680 [Acidobacteria bacterium]|nr:MAG: hypothetical protein DMF72_02680 [Acidobacteriota bacterium]